MGRMRDGKGTGRSAVLDDQGRQVTLSVTRSEIADAIDNGKGWNIGTGYLTLTTAFASDLLYLANTGEDNLIIDLYIVLTKTSTDGAGGRVDVEILRNPSGGTVVSDAVPVTPVNMNFGLLTPPPALIYSGGEGKTLTGHTHTLRSKFTDDSRLLLGIITELPPGASVGVRVTPPTGNSSMDVEAVLEMYVEE